MAKEILNSLFTNLGTEETRNLLQRIADISEDIYKFAWYKGKCTEQTKVSPLIYTMFADLETPRTVKGIVAKIEYLEKTLKEFITIQHRKACAENYFPEGFDFEDLCWDIYGVSFRYINEVEIPTVVENILDNIFSNNVECKGDFYEIRVYDFCNYVIECQTLSEAEDIITNYLDCGSLHLWKDAEKKYEELYIF